MFQSKQFVIGIDVVQSVASAADEFFAADQVLLGPDELFGASAPIQASLKRVSIVGVDYYFDGHVQQANVVSTPTTPLIHNNYLGLYKDTLDNAGVPDASGDFFLNVDQVNGTTNQQVFPERIIDRRSFTLNWSDPATNGFIGNAAAFMNPGLSAERRVRRRVSINAREALIFRLEILMPPAGTGQTNAFFGQFYGVVTYRVDL